jgi:hypothetical protein
MSQEGENIYKSKDDTVLEKDWVEGRDFQNPMAKSRAIKRVKEALFLATKKSSVKAMIVLSDLVSNLTRSPHFDKNETLVDYLYHFERKVAVYIELPTSFHRNTEVSCNTLGTPGRCPLHEI